MKSSQGEKSSFICGIVPEPSGTNIPIATKEKVTDSLFYYTTYIFI